MGFIKCHVPARCLSAVFARVYGPAHANINYVKLTRLEMLEKLCRSLSHDVHTPQTVKALPDRICEAEVYFMKISGFPSSSKIQVPSIFDIRI